MDVTGVVVDTVGIRQQQLLTEAVVGEIGLDAVVMLQ